MWVIVYLTNACDEFFQIRLLPERVVRIDKDVEDELSLGF